MRDPGHLMVSLVGSIEIPGAFSIPAEELSWSFLASGGPGGQHANRSATKAELRWSYGASTAINDEQRGVLASRLGRRGRGGVLVVTVDESRSQWRNRQIARRRVVESVQEALRVEPPRQPTRVSRSARRRRRDAKQRRSQTKRLRKPPTTED